jgi:hypothetical protein
MVSDKMEIQVDLSSIKGNVIYDDFYDNSNHWQQIYTVKNSFFGPTKVHQYIQVDNKNRVLKLINNSDEIIYSTINTNLSDKNDFEIEIDFEEINEMQSGFFILFNGDDNSYSYVRYSNEYFDYGNFVKKNDFFKFYIINQIAYFSNYLTNMKVVQNNNKLSLFVNDEMIFDNIEHTFKGAKIGVGAMPGSEFSISNLIVTSNSIGDKIKWTENETYYVSASSINVRENSNKTSDVITKIKQGEPVVFLGDKGIKKYAGRFANGTRNDYYYKVKIQDGTQGWVHGGGFNEIKIRLQP